LVQDRLPERLLLAHVGEDRPLRARGDDRLTHALDPDERAPPVPATLVADRLERVDLVGARVLAEAEKDHAVAVCHAGIIAAAPGAPPVPCSRGARDPVPPPNKGWGSIDPPPSGSKLAGCDALVCDAGAPDLC